MEPLNRLVIRIVSSRLATIRARQIEKNTSGSEKQGRVLEREVRPESIKVCTVKMYFIFYNIFNGCLCLVENGNICTRSRNAYLNYM